MSIEPPEPPPFAKPPRSAMTIRDMLVALAILAVLVLGFGGLTGSCSFSPGGPAVDDGRLPPVDVAAELRDIAARVDFTVRIPAVPPGWRSNSVDRDGGPTGDLEIVRVGFVTAEGRYLRLLQSDASEEELLAVETGEVPLLAQGPVEVSGQRFVGYGADGEEPVWIGEVAVADAEPVRVLITGSGSPQEFEALAEAVLAGEILPAGRR